MATNYYFRAVASDGKLRTGVVHGETEKWVANELRRQGLTPVYVGVEEKKSLELKLPSFRGGNRRGRPVLHAGALDAVERRRACGSCAVDNQRTNRASRVQARRSGRDSRTEKRQIAGRQPGDTSPTYFSELYINMVRAGEASGSLAAVFERLAEFERTRDDLAELHHLVDGLSGAVVCRRHDFGDLSVDFRGPAVRAGVSGFPH